MFHVKYFLLKKRIPIQKKFFKINNFNDVKILLRVRLTFWRLRSLFILSDLNVIIRLPSTFYYSLTPPSFQVIKN